MPSDQDSFDHVLIPSSTTYEQKLGKFQPKSQPKITIRTPTASNLPDAAKEILTTVEPPTRTSDLEQPVEGKIPPALHVSKCSTNAPDLHAAQESLTQMEILPAEPVISSIHNENTSLHNQQESAEVADMDFSVDHVDDLIQPSPTTYRSVAKFQQRTNIQSRDQKFATVPTAVPPVEEFSIASTINSGICTPGAVSSEVNVTEELFCESKGPKDHAEGSRDEIQVSEDDMNMQTDTSWFKEEMVSISGMESPDDFLQPGATTGQTDSKFQPMQCSKSVEPTRALSDFSDSGQLIPPSLEPLPHSFDAKCLEEGADLSAISTTVSLLAGTSSSEFDTINGPDHLEASLSEVFLFNAEHEDSWTREQENLVADVFFSMESFDDQTHPNPILEASQGGVQLPPCDGNLQTVPDRSETEEIAVPDDMESLNDILPQSCATTVDEAGKFQPKLVSGQSNGKAKSVSFIFPDPAETVDTLEYEFSFSQNERPEESACNSMGMDTSFLQIMNEESVERTVHLSSTITDCHQDFQMDHDRFAEEDGSEFPRFDSLIPQATSTTARSVGKFRPKPTVRTNDVKHSALMIDQNARVFISSQCDPLPREIESLDVHSTSFAAGSLAGSSAMMTCTSMVTDLSQEQTNLVEISCVQTKSLDGNEVLEANDSTRGRENNIGGKGECAEVSTHSGEVGESQNVDELTEYIIGETPASRTLEDGETRGSSMKLRKRIHISNPSVEIDDGPNDNLDVEDSISQMDEYHNDDEYRGEDVPKPKRTSRKPKKLTEIDKPIRRRKKSCEESESTKSPIQEPPNKKKFPHGTRRKRRQVDKALLEMPEDEINPRQLSIKNLILLAEAKERISNKVAAVLGKADPNVSNTGFNKDSPFGEEQGLNLDGEEANHHIQQPSNKLNYHSYMNRPQSVRWSKSETELFYKAIRQFGTDFAMIQQLFPSRTRHQVKLKFKNEERKHPLQVSDALMHGSKDHSHFELVIQQLQAQAEQNAKRDPTIDPTTTSQDVVGDDEEKRENSTKEEEQDATCWQGEAQNSAKSDDRKSKAQSPDKFNESQGAFDWDSFTL